MTEITFVGFYPDRPFWAGDKVTLQDQLLPSQVSRDCFERQMGETVFCKEAKSYSLRVSRDGRVLLRVSAIDNDTQIEKIPKYLDYLNAFYLLLDSATLEIDHLGVFSFHELSHRNVICVTYREDRPTSENVPSESIASTFQFARYLSSYRQDLPIKLDQRIVSRRVVSLEAIAHACNLFESAMSIPGLETTLASFAKSLAEYKAGNYPISLILAWFIIESHIHYMWNNKIDSLNGDIAGQKRINRERRDFLTGPDVTASIVSNVMELFCDLDHTLFKDIDHVRKRRNDVVHKTKPVSAADACRAMKTAQLMIESRSSIKFTPNFSRSQIIL